MRKVNFQKPFFRVWRWIKDCRHWYQRFWFYHQSM